MTIKSQLVLKWRDYRLKWNAEEFNVYNLSLISTEDIWIPDIVVHNS